MQAKLQSWGSSTACGDESVERSGSTQAEAACGRRMERVRRESAGCVQHWPLRPRRASDADGSERSSLATVIFNWAISVSRCRCCLSALHEQGTDLRGRTAILPPQVQQVGGATRGNRNTAQMKNMIDAPRKVRAAARERDMIVPRFIVFRGTAQRVSARRAHAHPSARLEAEHDRPAQRRPPES